MKNEILSKLERLQEYVRILNSYRKYSIQEIKKDFTLKGAVERYLEVSLECVLDIGAHSQGDEGEDEDHLRLCASEGGGV